MEHWTSPQESQDGHIALVLGNCCHLGLRMFYETGDIELAHQRAKEALERDFVPQGKWDTGVVLKHLHRGLQRLLEGHSSYPGALTWAKQETVLQIDPGHTEWVEGNDPGHPDLISEVEGKLIITDTKTQLAVDPKFVPRRLLEYETKFQLWFYAWRSSTVLRKPIEAIRVQWLSFIPLQYQVVTFSPTEEQLAHWLNGAKKVWWEINVYRTRWENHKLLPPPNYMSCWGRYGRCDAYDVCHKAQCDPQKMEALGWNPIPMKKCQCACHIVDKRSVTGKGVPISDHQKWWNETPGA